MVSDAYCFGPGMKKTNKQTNKQTFRQNVLVRSAEFTVERGFFPKKISRRGNLNEKTYGHVQKKMNFSLELIYPQHF